MKRIKLFHQKHTYENTYFILSQGLEKAMDENTYRRRNSQDFMKKSTKKQKKILMNSQT